MRLRLRSHETLIVATVALALAASACVKQGPPGVSISPLKADIVFGVKVPEPPAAPANTNVAAAEEFDETSIEEFDEKVLEIPEIRPIARTPVGQAAEACPAAALTAFPKQAADVSVKGLPEPGVYKFKRTITLTRPGQPPAVNTGFEQHVVRRVTPTPGRSYEFSYQIVQPDNVTPGQFVLTTFRVNSNPTVVQQVNRPPQTVGVVPVPGAEAVVTPPSDEPGMFVDKIERQSASGAPLGQPFQPARPLKYLPLDEAIVKAGQTFDTVGISPSNSQVIRHQGIVTRKTRVDACGEIVEGWLMESTRTVSGELSDTKYLYNIATQFGALVIAETTDIPRSDGGRLTVDLSLADPNPQPLPDNLK